MALTHSLATIGIALPLLLPGYMYLAARGLARRRDLTDLDRVWKLARLLPRVGSVAAIGALTGSVLLSGVSLAKAVHGLDVVLWGLAVGLLVLWGHGGALWVLRDRERQWRGLTFSWVGLCKQALTLAVLTGSGAGLGFLLIAVLPNLLWCQGGDGLSSLLAPALVAVAWWAPSWGALRSSGTRLGEGPLLEGIRAHAERWGIPLGEVWIEDTHGALRIRSLPTSGGGLMVSDGLVERMSPADGVVLAWAGLAQLEAVVRWRRTSWDRGALLLAAWMLLASFSVWVTTLPHQDGSASPLALLELFLIYGSLLGFLFVRKRFKENVRTVYRRVAEMCGGAELYLKSTVRAILAEGASGASTLPTVALKELRTVASAMAVSPESLDALIQEVVNEPAS